LKGPENGPAIEDWLAAQSARPLPWLVTFAILLAVQISPWWYPTPDATTYLSMARGIALTHRLSNLGGIHLGYPPGYPLLISPAFLISSRPFVVLSIIHWMMAVIFMAGVYRWIRPLAPAAAVLLTGLVMVNVALWIYYRRTLSEMAFMAAMIWTVLALNSALDAASGRGAAMRTAIGTALLIALVMIRETGVLLAAGFAVAALLDIRDAKLRWMRGLSMAVAVASPAIVTVAAFLIYALATARAAPSAVFGTHLSGFFDAATPILPRVIEGLRLRISEAGRLVAPGMFKAYAGHGQWLHVDVLIYLTLFAAIALGWWRLIRSRHDVLAATAPFYFALYVVWAFDADTRYLLPLLPLLVVCLWFVIEPFTRWRLSALALLLVAHLGVALGYWTTVEIPRGMACNDEWTRVAALAPQLKNGTDMVVATHHVPECARLMLSFLIDRPVPERIDPKDFPNAQRIVEWWSDPNPPGFKVRQSAGPYKLLVWEGPR
jgi:hypothetical protein